MWEAIRYNHLNIVKYYIEILHADPNGTDRAIPLIACSLFNRNEIAAYILSRGGDINIVSHGGYCPLIVAALYDQLEMVDFLIKQPGINVKQCRKCEFDYD